MPFTVNEFFAVFADYISQRSWPQIVQSEFLTLVARSAAEFRGSDSELAIPRHAPRLRGATLRVERHTPA